MNFDRRTMLGILGGGLTGLVIGEAKPKLEEALDTKMLQTHQMNAYIEAFTPFITRYDAAQTNAERQQIKAKLEAYAKTENIDRIHKRIDHTPVSPLTKQCKQTLNDASHIIMGIYNPHEAQAARRFAHIYDRLQKHHRKRERLYWDLNEATNTADKNKIQKQIDGITQKIEDIKTEHINQFKESTDPVEQFFVTVLKEKVR